MDVKCIKCGGERTHSSRVRTGERTLSMLFLRPIRCRDCKERFWVKNPSAYLALGATLVVALILVAMVWLVIEHNMADQYVAPPPSSESGKIDADLTKPARRHEPPPVAASTNSRTSVPARTTPDPRDPREMRTAATPWGNSVNDHQFTVRLYEESAENGNMDAQYKLGLLYLTGNGALQDFAEAAKWLKLSAEQGYGPAQYELGMIYRSGYGLPAEPVQSYVWLNLAAAAGVSEAKMARDEVMRGLSAKQLAQAQKISREWLDARSRPHTPGNARTTEPKKDPAREAESSS